MRIPEFYEHATGRKVLSGINALGHIPYELKIAGVTRVMVLTDTIVGALPFMKPLLASVAEILPYEYVDAIPADAPVAVAETIAERYTSTGCNGILAVGGGSVLDCAKAVNLLVSKREKKVADVMGMDHVSGEFKPFIAVPTTSGTGSEATKVAVVSDTANAVKMEIITGKIIPSVAVLDPECTLSLPPKVTASTGFDALTHAIEALWSLQANPLSQTEAYAALALIRDHLEKAVDNPRDTHARLALANGSYLAGAAFSNAMVGAVHAIGHAAGAVCHVAHGDIMAVLLPAVMQANLPAAEDTIGELLYWLEGASVMAETPAAERALKAIESIRALRRRLKEKAGLAETLRDLNITETSFDAICEKALDDGAGMTNPIPLDHAFVRQVLELCR